jgi:hypothetical protein
VILGIGLSTLLSDPRHVHRKDGTPVVIEAVPTFKEEVMSLIKLCTDKKILLLTPAFLASNWFYAYQFGMNAAYFSLRARALNSMMYWLMQTFGTFGIAAILDASSMKRRTRGLVGYGVVATFVLVAWIGGTVFQSEFSRADAPVLKDWTDPGWGGPFVLYLTYGCADAMFQSLCYW